MTFGTARKLALFLLAGSGLAALWLTGEFPLPLGVLAVSLLLLGWWAAPLRSRGFPPTPLLTAAPGLLAVGALLDLLFLSESLLLAAARLVLGLLLYTWWTMQRSQDRWRLTLLTLMTLVVAAALTARPAYLAVFAAAGLLTIWVLVLLQLEGEAPSGTALQERRDLATAGFFLGIGLLALLAFVLTALLFVLLPRLGAGFALERSRGGSVTGFTEQVTLGTFGRLAQDETVVLRIVFPDGRPAGPLYWRGLALDAFDGEHWRQSDVRRLPLPRSPDGFTPVAIPRSARLLRQEIFREALDSRVLFGAAWPVGLEGLPPGVSRDAAGAVYLPVSRAIPLQYVVLSDPLSPDPRAGQLSPAERKQYLALPPLAPALDALARAVAGEATRPAEVARRLEAYLAAHYTYSLDLTRPPGRGVLEDFLFGRREGYCELFATALAIQLRSLGIPARVAVGFLNGTWNEYGGYLAVRQADAHAWVEAFLAEEGWRILDPSPRATFDAARPAPLLGAAGRYLDFLWLRWNRSVVGFSAADQLTLALWLKTQTHAWRKRIGRGWEWGQAAAPPAALFLLSAGAAVAGLSLLRRRRSTPVGRAPLPAVPFYALALRRLRRAGFVKPPALTPAEFAERVVREGGELFAPLRELVRAYYAVRFGGVRLSPEGSSSLLALARALPRRRAR